MAAKPNGLWDFKSYDEKTWFRSLVWALSILLVLYVLLHVFFYDGRSNYEYTRLSQDQMQLINRIYMDADTTVKTPTANKAINGAIKTGTPPAKTDSSKKDTIKKNIPADTSRKPAAKTTIAPQVHPAKQAALCQKAMDYLTNTFDNKLDSCQTMQVKGFLCEASSQEATAFLNGTRFRVRSYFWLIGPSVYWEVYFWSIFGVLSSLLFALGAVGSNSTSDLGNPKSQFDSSEIYGQVAKLFYAPLCTLAVVFGYNYFKDANVVDISSSKGIIAFAFIGGFYSSRVVALMDRLKDVLLPNSGAAALPAANAPAAVITLVTVKLQPDPALPAATLATITPVILNTATVQMKSTTNNNTLSGSRKDGDPDGTFSFSSVPPDNYIITADLKHTLPDSSVVHLSAQLLGPLKTGTAPIVLYLKPVS